MLELKKESGPDSVFWSARRSTATSSRTCCASSCRPVRQQQLRPPGAHLPLHDGRGRREHVGLRRDDELVQRHAQHASARCTSARNAAEAHPVSMLHMLHAKETGAKMIVVDPRFTRTAAKADEYVRIRSGTDIPFLFGMLHHIFKNGWEDKKYIDDRVYGMDKVKRRGAWPSGRPTRSRKPAASPRRTVLQGRRDDGQEPAVARSSGAWARPSTRSATRSCARRASCSSRSATSASSGGGANIFRGHDNVQGATDVGPNPDSLPGYYGLADRRVEALRARSGASTTSGSRSSSRPGDDGASPA